jgi:hypothetical protein
VEYNISYEKHKAIGKQSTDDLWAKIETLQWFCISYVYAVKNERMVVVMIFYWDVMNYPNARN